MQIFPVVKFKIQIITYKCIVHAQKVLMVALRPQRGSRLLATPPFSTHVLADIVRFPKNFNND